MQSLKNFLITISAILFLAEQANYPQSNIIKTVKRGMEYSYNFDWDKAENVFQGLIKKYPKDPRGYHYESGIYFWYYMSNHEKQNYDLFVAYSDSTIDLGKAKLKKFPDDPDLLFILGSNYSYRTMAFAKAEKFLDAVWASKKSESYLSQVLDIDSTYYDAYLGLGLYYFGVGQIPSAFRWALSLAGIHGDKDMGLKCIRIAAREGDLTKVEAEYYFSQILSDFLFDYNSSSRYLQNLVNQYPHNLLFNYSLAVVDIKKRKLNDAQKILEKILDQDDSEFRQIISFSNFLMGDVYFKRNQFAAASDYYSNFISDMLSNDYKGIAYFRLAVCKEILGDRNSASRYFSLSDKGNMNLEDDIYAKREGAIYAKRTMAVTEIDLIKFSNFIDHGRYKLALDSLSGLLEKAKTDKLKSEIYLSLSDAAFGLGKYEESLNYAVTAKALNSFDEKWVKPFACYYAARASNKLDNYVSAKNFVEEAESYSDYDYQKKLKDLLSSLTIDK